VNDNNPIRYFEKECIIRERRSGSVIMLKTMMERWRSWANENLCESQCLKWDARDLESALQKYDIRIKKSNKRGYHGYRLKDTVDDVDGSHCGIEMSPSPPPEPNSYSELEPWPNDARPSTPGSR
jgi:hypothetical protein